LFSACDYDYQLSAASGFHILFVYLEHKYKRMHWMVVTLFVSRVKEKLI